MGRIVLNYVKSVEPNRVRDRNGEGILSRRSPVADIGNWA
jgi:hypothetical protein